VFFKYFKDFKALASCPLCMSQIGLSGVQNMVIKTGKIAPINAIHATIRQCKYKPVQYINNIPKNKNNKFSIDIFEVLKYIDKCNTLQ